MAQTLSLKDYHDALIGGSVTENWDVLVCYTAKELNALLATQWAAGGTTNIEIVKAYPKFRTKTVYNLTLGAPRLQFIADKTDGVALKCSLDGTYRDDRTDKDGNVIEKGAETNTIPHGAYVMSIVVPIQAVHADGSPSSEPNVINFASDKEASSYIIFHFQNTEATSFKVFKTDTVVHDEDTSIVDLSGNDQLSSWFSNPQNVNWINVAIAQITNLKGPTSGTEVISDLLRPKSFRFATQSNADGGVLLVFIQTEGSESEVGRSAPSFRAPQNKNDVSAIPSGYHSCIIINHDLFLKKFLLQQLSLSFKTDIQPVDTLEGFELKCPLNQDKIQFQSRKGNWIRYEDIHGVKVDFTKDPLLHLTVKDDAHLVTSATWSWNKETELSWSFSEFGAFQQGNIKFEITVNESAPTASIISNLLQLKVKLTADAFKCNAQAIPWPWWVRIASPGGTLCDTLPDSIQNLRFQFDDVSLTLPELDFFATQNVFAPGKQAILPKTTISPYDFIVIGDIVSSDTLQPPTHQLQSARLPAYRRHEKSSWHRLRAPLVKSQHAVARALRSVPDVVRTKAMFDALYTDDFGFAHDFVSAIESVDPKAFGSVFSQRGYDLDSLDASCMDTLSVPGPDFDLRFVGGAYKLRTEDIVFVDSKNRTILFNHNPVSNQKMNQDGTVTFTTPDKQRTYSLQFSRKYNEDGEILEDKCFGMSWDVGNPDKQSASEGDRYFIETLMPKQRASKHHKGKARTRLGVSEWYNAPQYLIFANLLTIFAGIDVTLKVLKFLKKETPKAVEGMKKLGRKLNLIGEETEAVCIARMQQDVRDRKIDKKDIASVDVEIRRAAHQEITQNDMSDPAVQERVMNSIRDTGRSKSAELIKSMIQGVEIGQNSVVIALGGGPAFQDRLEDACKEKFDAIMIEPPTAQAAWEDYLKATVEYCRTEQSWTDATRDILRIRQAAEEAEQKKETVDRARIAHEEDVKKRRKAIDDNPELQKNADEKKKALEKLDAEIEAEGKHLDEDETEAEIERVNAEDKKKKGEDDYEEVKKEMEKKTKAVDTRRALAFK